MNDKNQPRTLAVDGVSVHLAGVQILDEVTFTVAPGDVFGVVRPTAGTIRYGETDLPRVPPHKMRQHGIGRSLQATHYFRDLTVAQFVSLGQLPNSVAGALRFTGHRPARRPGRPAAADSARDQARGVLAQLGLDELADRPLSELSTALQKLADIARTFVTGTVIDHDPGFVTGICDRMLAMNFGQVLHVGRPDEVMSNEVVRRSYLGEPGAVHGDI